MREVEQIFAKVTACPDHISVRDLIDWREQNTGYGRGFCSDVVVEFIVTVEPDKKGDSVGLQCSGGDKMRFWELRDAFERASRPGAKAEQSEKKADEGPTDQRRLTLTSADNDASARRTERGWPENNRADEMAILAGAVATNHNAFKHSKDLQERCWTIVNDVSEHNREILRNAMKILAECAKYRLLTVQNDPTQKERIEFETRMKALEEDYAPSKQITLYSRELHFQFSELQKHWARSK